MRHSHPPALVADGVGARAPVDLLRSQHRQELLLGARCGACAERVPYRLILSEGACPHCASALSTEGQQGARALLAQVGARWRRWRMKLYGGLGMTTLLASLVPFVSTLLLGVTFLAVQFAFVRPLARWLGPVRRVTTRLTLKLLFSALMLVHLVSSTLLLPWVGLAQGVSTLMNVAFAAVYFEFSLWLVQNRIRREGEKRSVDAWEVALPAVLLASTAAALLAVALGAVALHRVLLEADLPGLTHLVKSLSEAGGP